MNDCGIMVIIFIALFILLVCGYIYCILQSQIDDLYGKTRSNSRSKYSKELFIKVIATISVAFCLIFAIHYICVFFPRIATLTEHKKFCETHGIDYLGIVIAFFGILVTLLVGWQIFNAVEVRKEIASIKDEFEKRYTSDIEKLRERSKSMNDQSIKHNGDINEITNRLNRFEIEIDSKVDRADLERRSDITLGQASHQLATVYLGLIFNNNISNNNNIANPNMTFRYVVTELAAIARYLTHNEDNDALDVINSIIALPPRFFSIDRDNKERLINNINRYSNEHQLLIEPLRVWIQQIPEV